MSALQSIPDPPRSAREVAAETLVLLFHAGVIGRTQPSIASALRALGLSTQEFREAYTRHEQGRVRPFDEQPVDGGPPPALRAGRPASSAHQAANRRRWEATHPEPGKRRCASCGKTKPLDEFFVKNRRTGNRDAYCKPCRRDYGKRRYARVGTAVVAVELLASDPLVGESCPRCGRAFENGDVVIGEISVCHETCR